MKKSGEFCYVQVRCRFNVVRWFSLSWLIGLALIGALGAGAQAIPAEVYGPYNAVFLADGPGITEPQPAEWPRNKASAGALPDGVLDGKGKWALTFWFQMQGTGGRDQGTGNGLTPLAGIGDVAAKDARYVALVDGRLGLWMGKGQDHFVAADAVVGDGWHFAAATGDGSAVTLYGDGREVGSMPYAQESVAARLMMAPAG